MSPKPVITNTHQELMDMFDHLPFCTLFFDEDAELFFVNKAASSFLLIDLEKKIDYREYEIVSDIRPVYRIIDELQQKKEVNNERMLLLKGDGYMARVQVSASLHKGLEDVYIFQFAESKIALSANLLFFTNSICHDIQKLRPHLDDKGKGMLDTLVENLNTDMIDTYERLDENAAKQISSKFPCLTNYEVIICCLLLSRMSDTEIAHITHKTHNWIRGTIQGISRKLNLRSRTEIYFKLMDLQT